MTPGSAQTLAEIIAEAVRSDIVPLRYLTEAEVLVPRASTDGFDFTTTKAFTV